MKVYFTRLVWTGFSFVRDTFYRSLFVIATLTALCTLVAFTNQAAQLPAALYPCIADPHSGVINTDRDWCPDANPHIISGWVTIEAGTTVNIQPGVEVRVDAAQGMLVYGALIAEGSSGSEILFTSKAGSPTAGDWVGLSVWNGSTVHMDYIDLAYAGRDYSRALYVQVGSDFQIDHARIHHNQGYGIALEGAGLSAQLQNLEVDHNTQYPIAQSTVDMTLTYVNVSFHDNGSDALIANGGNVTRDVTLDGSPAALNGAPLYLLTSLTIPSPFKLTVTPGSTLMVGADQQIWVQSGGTLSADGTAGQRITFTRQTTAPTSGWDRIALSWTPTYAWLTARSATPDHRMIVQWIPVRMISR